MGRKSQKQVLKEKRQIRIDADEKRRQQYREEWNARQQAALFLPVAIVGALGGDHSISNHTSVDGTGKSEADLKKIAAAKAKRLRKAQQRLPKEEKDLTLEQAVQLLVENNLIAKLYPTQSIDNEPVTLIVGGRSETTVGGITVRDDAFVIEPYQDGCFNINYSTPTGNQGVGNKAVVSLTSAVEFLIKEYKQNKG